MKNSLFALDAEHDDRPLWETLKHGIIPLLDSAVSDWTPTESQAVTSALMGLTQEETAVRWQSSDGKTPPGKLSAVPCIVHTGIL